MRLWRILPYIYTVKRSYLAFLVLLTTCATMGTAARLDPQEIAQSLQTTPWEPLFPEISLMILELSSYPLRVFLVKIDNPHNKNWHITLPDSNDSWLRARTVRDFAQEFGLDLAINASYYQKRIQDDFVRPLGLWVVDSQVIGAPHAKFSAFGQGQDGRLYIVDPGSDYGHLRWAVGGGVRLLKNSIVTTSETNIHPRTALGLSADGNTLILAVIDGRQDHSRGISLVDLAHLFLTLGMTDALNLDGGGSSTLVVRRSSGEIEVLNSPWDHRLYGGERRVASHLGLKVSAGR